MTWFSKQRLLRSLRVIHRDLGFFVVGVCFIYGISGFLLNHMNGSDPAYRSRQDTTVIAKGLGETELEKVWTGTLDLPPVKKITSSGNDRLRVMCEGGTGTYDMTDGSLAYEVHRKRPFIFQMNKMHYNRVNGWNVMGDLFALSLLFFAISGLFMVKGRYGIAGRGKWFLLAGLVIPFLYVIFS